jgi:hypothetical protein
MLQPGSCGDIESAGPHTFLWYVTELAGKIIGHDSR